MMLAFVLDDCCLAILRRGDVPVPLLDDGNLVASIAELQAHLEVIHGALITDRERPS